MPAKKRTKAKPASRPRGRPRPEDAEAIQRKILDAALIEFLEYGYGDAAMARIAKRVGGSKTTLYSRYPSKEELFRAIIFAQIEKASPQASLEFKGEPLGLEQGLKSFANHMLKHSLQADSIAINKLIYSESYRFSELGAAAVEKTNLGIKRITRFIEESAKRDGVPCKNPAAVAKTFIFMNRGWYVNILLMNQDVSESERKQWVEESVDRLLLGRNEW